MFIVNFTTSFSKTEKPSEAFIALSAKAPNWFFKFSFFIESFSTTVVFTKALLVSLFDSGDVTISVSVVSLVVSMAGSCVLIHQKMIPPNKIIPIKEFTSNFFCSMCFFKMSICHFLLIIESKKRQM